VADRSVVVRLQAHISQYTQAMRQAADSTRQFGRDVEKSVTDKRQAYEQAGQAGRDMGATLAAGLGLAAKAAMDWESAWAGVTKTVEGSPEQMAALEDQLRGLATTLPATHEEIAAVAEAAGQLGIEREAVVGFTRTMIDLGETTNLTADEAATAMAKIANVMGTPQTEIDRLGSALVALGNEGASTEQDILSMALRIAGAGKLVGASEADVLAMANAMSSVGIEAELGGGVMSRTMQKIYQATKEGGQAVEGFARVAGMSAKDFAAKFEKDPVRAISAFIAGLDNVEASGGDVVGVLADLGIKGTEDLSVLLRLKGAGDLLNQSLDTGAQAWRKNTALVEEANKRYATSASRIKVAWNQVVDFAIAVGAVVLPAVAGLAENVGDLAGWFADLPGPVRQALALLGSVGAVAGLAGGALLLMLPRIADTRKALAELGVTAGRARGALAAVGRLGAAAAAVAALGMAADAAKPALDDFFGTTLANADQLTLSLVKLANTQQATGELSRVFGEDLADFGDALKRLVDPSFMERADDVSAWFAEAGGLVDWASGNLDQARDKFAKLDQSLASLVSGGNRDVAEKIFGQLAREAANAGVPVEKLKELLPGYADALAAADTQQELAAGSTATAGQALAEFSDAASEAEKAVEDFVTEIESLNTVLGLDDALIAYEQALDDLTDSIKDNGKTFDINTQKGRDNKAALNEVVKSALRVAQSEAEMAGSTDKANKVYDQHLSQLRKTLRSLGVNADEVEKLIGKYRRIPGTVETKPKQPGMSSAQLEADRLRAKYRSIPEGVATRISTPGIERARRQLRALGVDIRNLSDEDVRIRVEEYISGARVKRTGKGYEFAAGGQVPGRWAGRDDKMIAVGGEEFVVNAASTRKHLPLLKAINDDRVPGFADGGQVGRSVRATISEAVSGPLTERFYVESVSQSLMEAYASWLDQAIPGGGMSPNASVNAVAQRTAALLGRTGEWASWARRIMFESGGKWDAVNRWDSNWRAGHPSVGGAQVIGPTFRAHAGPYRKVGPYLYGVSIDPLANSYAGGHYAVSRYGSLAAVDPRVRPRGYDDAGRVPRYLAPGLTLAYNGTGRPERVLGPGQGAGGNVYNINLTNRGVIGSRLEVENWLAGAIDDMRRKGRLPAG
jgi:TP901 family phage tail tape measure protein